ncbi:MAG: type 1 glutamine amidotransferase [Desulfobulbaceae bacterium]|nr:MAG: type 1 glutamine amidotransferase [Desulfobulbaceae bacterium]
MKTRRAHWLQHVPFEGLGSIEAWLKNHDYQLSCTRMYESEPLPPLAEIDFLIIMGGPMSVNDADRYPWLTAELEFITRAIEQGKRILGVCLGAQLIARALGASVTPNHEKEIGWFEISRQPDTAGNLFQFPEKMTVFHWHGETFQIPRGANHLATSKGCRNQAFQYTGGVIGLQFHLETTVESARALVANCRDELIEGPYIQTEAALLNPPDHCFREMEMVLGEILNYLHQR